MMVNSSSNASSIGNCTSSGSNLNSCLRPWYIAAGVVVAVSCLLGIPANISVIVKLSQKLRGSSMSQRLFFNLAMSDVLCLLCWPVAVAVFITGPQLSLGVCKLLFYFFFFCIASDLNILVLISIQRYYQVLHPKKWDKLRRTWQRFLLFTVWMLGALVALPLVFLLKEVKNEDDLTDSPSCNSQMIRPVLQAIYILFIVSSHVVLLSFCLLLVRGVNRIKMPNKKRPRVTLLFTRIIATTLLVGFLPIVVRVVHLVALFMGSDKLLYATEMLAFVEYFYCFNYCLNPFLYFFVSRHHARESKTRSLLMPLNDNS